MKKEEYATPEIEIIEFETEDIITSSGISGQGHECRHHTCENAWKFISQFTR